MPWDIRKSAHGTSTSLPSFHYIFIVSRVSTAKMIGYLIALLPLYVLVYTPISNMLTGSAGFSSTSPNHERIHILNGTFLASKDDLPGDCTQHQYNVQIISRSPLVLYLTGFLSETEADHLIEIR
jgi:prolyl 4-hydroxylase